MGKGAETRMNWQDGIIADPEILVGKPIIKVTQISVELILDRVADGWTMDDRLAAHDAPRCLGRDFVP